MPAFVDVSFGRLLLLIEELPLFPGPTGVGSNITVSASDGDLGVNATLTFNIEAGNLNGAFVIMTADNSTVSSKRVGISILYTRFHFWD